MSASKQKGTRAESAVVAYLKENGFPHAERRALTGNKDKGDVSNIPGVVVEVKDCRTMTLAAWVDEANAEAVNAGVDIGVVIHHRPRKGDVGQWYATMDVDTLARLIR